MTIQRPKTIEEKSTKTTVDTIMFTLKELESWVVPHFQRPVKVNSKVEELAKQIAADGGVLPGVICFGYLGKEKYLLDGQQRRQAFLISGKEEGFADIRNCFFKTESEMSDEFVRLNSHLVNMTPDDILRGMEPRLKVLQLIREGCPFVGYDFIRRGNRAPILSMSVLIRCWSASLSEVPANRGSSAKMAEQLTDQDGIDIVRLLKLAFSAWGPDLEYSRLWTAANLTMVCWIYRRIVLSTYSSKTQRFDDNDFGRCLMALSSDPVYIDWLQNRRVGERDRAPLYGRMKMIFTNRYYADTGKKANLPAPAWAHGYSR